MHSLEYHVLTGTPWLILVMVLWIMLIAWFVVLGLGATVVRLLFPPIPRALYRRRRRIT